MTSHKVECKYKEKCSASGTFSCQSCRHNTGKKNYYEPEKQPQLRYYWEPQPTTEWFPIQLRKPIYWRSRIR